MVHAAQKGEKPASGKVAKAAQGMTKKAAKDFATTKHKGLPEKVEETFTQKVHKALFENHQESGEETIEIDLPFKGRPAGHAIFRWEGREESTRDYPGNPGRVEILAVYHNGKKIKVSGKAINMIQSQALEYLNDLEGSEWTSEYEEEPQAQSYDSRSRRRGAFPKE